MRKMVLGILMGVGMGIGIVSAGEHGDHHVMPPTTAPATQASAPVNKFCAVEQENPITADITTTYKGKTIGFCCKDCIPLFEKDPEKYMAKLK